VVDSEGGLVGALRERAVFDAAVAGHFAARLAPPRLAASDEYRW